MGDGGRGSDDGGLRPLGGGRSNAGNGRDQVRGAFEGRLRSQSGSVNGENRRCQHATSKDVQNAFCHVHHLRIEWMGLIIISVMITWDRQTE